MTPAVCRVLYSASHPAWPERRESVSEVKDTHPALGCQPQNDGLECENDGARGGGGRGGRNTAGMEVKITAATA